MTPDEWATGAEQLAAMHGAWIDALADTAPLPAELALDTSDRLTLARLGHARTLARRGHRAAAWAAYRAALVGLDVATAPRPVLDAFAATLDALEACHTDRDTPRHRVRLRRLTPVGSHLCAHAPPPRKVPPSTHPTRTHRLNP